MSKHCAIWCPHPVRSSNVITPTLEQQSLHVVEQEFPLWAPRPQDATFILRPFSSQTWSHNPSRHGTSHRIRGGFPPRQVCRLSPWGYIYNRWDFQKHSAFVQLYSQGSQWEFFHRNNIRSMLSAFENPIHLSPKTQKLYMYSLPEPVTNSIDSKLVCLCTQSQNAERR